MTNKAKFAFGSLSRLQSVLDSGQVDAFDILCLVDDGVARIGWVDKNGTPQIIGVPEDDVLIVEELPEVGKKGVIYILESTVYIWSGSEYILISENTDLIPVQEQLDALDSKTASLEEAISSFDEEKLKEEIKIYAEEVVENKILETVTIPVIEF